MSNQMFAVATTAFCFVMTGAYAMTKSEYDVAKQKIESEYSVSKTKCETLKDNAKDVCMKRAKGTEEVAKAELEQQYKPSASNARKVSEEKAKMTYEVAKEKCDEQTGDSKAACVDQAKANYDKAKASIEAKKS